MQQPSGPATPPPTDPESRQREQLAAFLGGLLTLVFVGGFGTFLVIISFGLFLWVVVIAGAVAAFVGFHYLVWGRWGPYKHDG